MQNTETYRRKEGVTLLDATKEIYEVVTVLGKQMLFTCQRIARKTVPQGLYMYEVRHDDAMQGIPCQIANWIMVNHWGTLISDTPLELGAVHNNGNSYLDIDAETDWGYEGYYCSLGEYMTERKEG